jgi:N6-adenosine-specific RNA methylase IME4
MTAVLRGHLGHFDNTPIKLQGFQFKSRACEPVGRPTPDQWTRAAEFAVATEEASPYWVGDLLTYAHDRADWTEKLDQLLEITGLSRKTLYNLVYVSRHVGIKAREIAPSITHAKAVAGLDLKDQLRVLKQAREEELTVAETAKAAKRITRPRIIEGQAVLAGKFRVIYADPPWTYDNNKPMPDGSQTPAESSYDGMTIEQLCELPVSEHAEKDAVLFCWTTNSHLLENPGPRDVLEAWGFKYKTNYAWDKVLGRPGHYSYVQHEILLVATRGRCTPDVDILQHDHASLQRFRRKGEHSQKPEEFRRLITNLYPRGPYLELFGRRPVEGWTVFGNDARLWAKGVPA